MSIEFKPENKEKEKTLSEIISLNDNGDSLIDLLKLKGLKASYRHSYNMSYFTTTLLDENGSVNTTLINNSGMFKNIKGDLKEDGGGFLSRLIKKLNDSSYKKYPLVDFGTNGEVEISIFAQKIEVQGVVAVDILNQIEEKDLEKMKDSEEYKNKKFPVLGLKIDMLELLKQLPDNSCNISLFSINEDIIKSEKYKKEFMDQLYRVVPEDGIVINVVSILDRAKEEFPGKWQDLGELEGSATDYIFKKITKPIT